MRIHETCSCGASVEVRFSSPALAREAVDHWRDSHRHEVRDTAPVAAQDGQQAVIDPDGWACSDCGGSPVDCGRGIHCMAERAPLPASGQQAAPIAHEGETVLFDLARMASGQAYPVTISGQRVVAVKNHQDNINFYPLDCSVCGPSLSAPVAAQWGLVAQDGTTGNGRVVDCEGCEVCDALQLRPPQ